MVKIPKELLKKLVSYLQTVSNNHIHGEPDQNGVDRFYLQGAAQQLLSEIEVCTPTNESD